jgi:Protein of unknown function (DUF3102)
VLHDMAEAQEGEGMTAVARIDCRAEVAGSNRLPVLAATINEHLEAAETATRRGLEHAIAAGLLLIEAKELVAHGEWIPWLKANCRLSPRQAQVYMRLARNRDGAQKRAGFAFDDCRSRGAGR